MELGARTQLVVTEHADLQVAVERLILRADPRAKCCTASSIAIVTDAVHDRFVAAVTQRLATWRVGDARADDTDMGPVVMFQPVEQDLRYPEIARPRAPRSSARFSPCRAGHYLSGAGGRHHDHRHDQHRGRPGPVVSGPES